MWSVRLLAACGLLLAACGAVEPAPSHRVAAKPTPAPTRPTTVRFVAPPLVFYSPEDGNVDVWVRLNRPLHHNVGEPHDYADTGSSLTVPGTHGDIPGLEHDALRPTCYSQGLYRGKDEPPLAAGDPVQVTLELGHGQRVTATATTQIPEHYPDGEELLGCPRLPDTRICHSEVYPPKFDEISVTSATGTSCATAHAVMQSVARWANSDCWEHLCVSRHRINRGFRCDAGLAGEAAWDIICDRGKAEVRGFAAD